MDERQKVYVRCRVGRGAVKYPLLSWVWIWEPQTQQLYNRVTRNWAFLTLSCGGERDRGESTTQYWSVVNQFWKNREAQYKIVHLLVFYQALMVCPKLRISHVAPINLCRTLNEVRVTKYGKRDLWVVVIGTEGRWRVFHTQLKHIQK